MKVKNQPHRVKARREIALIRRQANLKWLMKTTQWKGVDLTEKQEAKRQRKINAAQVDIRNLEEKLAHG